MGNFLHNFPMVTILLPATLHTLLPMMSKADKTKPVAHENKTNLVTKLSMHVTQLIIIVNA